MNSLIKKVQEWSEAKDIHNAKPTKQILKVIEEFGEIGDALLRESCVEVNHSDAYYEFIEECMNDLKDAIGDTHVTLIILCQQLGLDYLIYPETEESTLKQSENQPVKDLYLEMSVTVSYITSILTRGKLNTEDVSNIRNYVGWLKQGLDCLAYWYDTDSVSCLQIAYDVIAKRTGKTIDGIFVKSEDLERGA